MKKILLATTLLSIVMSDNILMESYLTPKTIWVRDKQFWNKNKIKRASLNEISPKIEELSNYDDDRQLSRISKTIISDARKLPSVTIMRPSDLTLLPQIELLSSDKTKLDSTKPTVMISIGLQERKNYNSQENFLRKNHRKHTHAWLIEQPFYVDEPRWINIYPDGDISTEDDVDPYILTRGKKIFKVKDIEQTEKMIENYDDFLNKYPSRSKSRVRRSVEMNAINDTKDQKKEINYYNVLQDTDSNNIMMTKSYKIDNMSEDIKTKKDIKNSIHNTFLKKCQENKTANVTEKLPREFKLIKQNRTSANAGKMINFVDQKQNILQEEMSNYIKSDNSKSEKINRDKFNNRKNSLTNMNKRNKRSVPLTNKNFSEVPKKYKTQEIDTSSEKNVERIETNVYEQMKNKAYIDKLDDSDTYNDAFTSFSKKSGLDNRTENSNENNINYNRSIEKPWKIRYYAHDKKLESEEESRNEKNERETDKNNTEATQLINELKSFRIKNYLNYRKKRSSACNSCKIDSQFQDQRLKDIEREIQDSSLERRNKHSDILEDLSLLNELYVISRGKKASYKFENGIYSMLESRNVDDTDRIKVMSFPLALLKMLLEETSRCNDCDINVNRLSNKRSPRDRRGSLDEIFAAYDPYYVARGKRMNLDNFLTKMQSLRKKSTLFETDEK